ncbi:hypothetical protein RJ639_037605 [Escallonia herrerae]|uniref:Protein TIFY n=1 Tax=Escallonia herrerae TaxID=1293975 RepID=A0AA88WI36_9ASTE|nr:hypothetical protein RJ639_037605 [Escallonia herrerae]
MSCSTAVIVDFMKVEKPDQMISMERSATKNYQEQDSMNMFQSVGLFRKYLLTKAQRNIGKTNEDESEAIKRAPYSSGRLIPNTLRDATYRHPTLLEQMIFPQTRREPVLPIAPGQDYSKAQLTIFYSGNINVYDNVPPEKFQTIMLLAGGSAPIVTSTPDIDVAKPPQKFKLPSLCKLQADLPLARKLSLQRFLQKRRDRIINKAPYVSPAITARKHDNRDEDDRLSTNGDAAGFDNEHTGLFPFPSRFGYLLPVTASKGCQKYSLFILLKLKPKEMM